jgi:DNA-binding beta-propeller fold protein YncE
LFPSRPSRYATTITCVAAAELYDGDEGREVYLNDLSVPQDREDTFVFADTSLLGGHVSGDFVLNLEYTSEKDPSVQDGQTNAFTPGVFSHSIYWGSGPGVLLPGYDDTPVCTFEETNLVCTPWDDASPQAVPPSATHFVLRSLATGLPAPYDNAPTVVVTDLVAPTGAVPAGIALDLLERKVYWTELGNPKIRRANLDGTNTEDLYTFEGGAPCGISLDVEGGKMYWTDQGNAAIRRADLDGAGAVEDLVTTGDGETSSSHGVNLSDPCGIALDVAGGKMYWVDNSAGSIRRLNLDANGDIEALVDWVVEGNNPSFETGIALDVAGGKMYWTSGAHIWRADMDGMNEESIVSSGASAHSYGIALDVTGGKMYWTDKDVSRIQRANLDGSVLEDVVLSGLTIPAGIALDAASEKIYWADVRPTSGAVQTGTYPFVSPIAALESYPRFSIPIHDRDYTVQSTGTQSKLSFPAMLYGVSGAALAASVEMYSDFAPERQVFANALSVDVSRVQVSLDPTSAGNGYCCDDPCLCPIDLDDTCPDTRQGCRSHSHSHSHPTTAFQPVTSDSYLTCTSTFTSDFSQRLLTADFSHLTSPPPLRTSDVAHPTPRIRRAHRTSDKIRATPRIRRSGSTCANRRTTPWMTTQASTITVRGS